jgi:predicted nucleic acid-binding protein
LRTLTNTTLLSNFAAVGRLDLLQRLFGQIWITTEIYDELLQGLQEGYDFYTGIDQHIHPLASQGWIQLVSMADEQELRAFRSLAAQLDTGEASCLAIARHRGWAFLSDDKRARKQARAWQIPLSGTLGVLVQAVKRQVLTPEAGDQLLQAMIQRGYHSPYDTLHPLLQDDH